MFQRLYDSIWNVPVAPWVSGALLLAWCATRAGRSRPFVARFTALFAVAIMVDAWLDGPLTPLVSGSAAATASGVVFVVAGDLRYFVAVERALRGTLGRRGLATAAALSAVVPLGSEVFRRATLGADMRVVFLGYEAMFFALAVVLRVWILPQRLAGASDRTRRAVNALTAFEIAQYALWATADVVILWAKSDVGFGLRLVPNLMYYALFLPFAIVVMRKTEDETR